MMYSRITKVLAGVLALVALGCSDANDSNFNETGRLVVRLTDAPFPYEWIDAANVTIFKVEARQVTEAESETETSPYVTLMESEMDMNLLELQNGVTTTLADLEVPAGDYDLVRVYVKGVNVVLTDGRTFDLKVPSGEQTGIKVFITPGLTVTGGLSSDLILDFDVSRSFVAKGNLSDASGINGFNFKPVIKATNSSTAGTLAGRVSFVDQDVDTALEGATITVMAADTVNTTALTDVDGNYAIMGLTAGTYSVFAEAVDFISSDTLEVQIDAANMTYQDFVLEAQAETSGTGN